MPSVHLPTHSSITLISTHPISLIHLICTYSIHLFVHSSSHLSIHPFIYPFDSYPSNLIGPPIYIVSHLSIYLAIHSYIHFISFICFSIHSPINLILNFYIHLSIFWIWFHSPCSFLLKNSSNRPVSILENEKHFIASTVIEKRFLWILLVSNYTKHCYAYHTPGQGCVKPPLLLLWVNGLIPAVSMTFTEKWRGE